MPKPVSQEFLANLGRTIEHGAMLHRQGNFAEAEKIYTRILKTIPDQFETLQLLAQLKVQRGKAGEAFRLMSTAVALRPGSADALVNLGHVLRALKRDDEALASFDKALAIDPNNVEALGNRGDLLLSLHRAPDALACFEKILAAAPNHLGARANRGAALAALGRFEEAIADFDAVLRGAPNDPMALYNRGNALFGLGRYAEALAHYERVTAITPQHAPAWNNRGNTLTALDRHAEAIASFDKAIALKSDYADAQYNRALALLATGDYAKGFTAYEWRWKRTGMPHIRHNYGRPVWLGEFPLERKTILLHAEQGLGDTIQFARYVPLLARGGAKVVLEVEPALKPLLARLEGASQVVARGEPLPPFDVHCPLGSLPLALKTTLATVPAEIPYLAADESRVERWRSRLESAAAPRVALAWAGNPNHANDRNRSIPFSLLNPLLANGGVRFVSLQRELRAGDAEALAESGVLHVGNDLADLDDTAAALALCDLVVTVDTAVAHLSAAMGRPTFILLPFAPDWRWTLQGDTTPWYPAARLFRQPQLGDWASVIARVAGEIANVMGRVAH